MTKKIQPETSIAKSELEASQQENMQNDTEALSKAITQENDSLSRVAEKLEEASKNFSSQRAGLAEMLRMQNEIKSVLSQTIQGMANSSMNRSEESTKIAPSYLQQTVTKQGDCGCDGCIDTGCCCFEIVLDKVRAIQPQLEPADSGELPGVINELEVRIFASVDGRGILVPSLSTTMGLRVGSVLLGGKPGAWVSIDRVIEKVYVKKGISQTVYVDFQAQEAEEGAERLIGLKDEFGDASGSITLDCCVSKIYPPMPTDLSFEHGGTGGGVPGMISLAFYARRVCC